MEARNLIDGIYSEISDLKEGIEWLNPYPCSLNKRISFEEREERLTLLLWAESSLVSILKILEFTDEKMIERFARTTLQRLHRVKGFILNSPSAGKRQKGSAKC